MNILLLALPSIVLSCGSDVSGSSSASAEFDIAFFAPLAYTYPPDDADLVPGQSLTLAQANQRVKTDLDLAISKALTDNQLYLASPPTVNYTFTPQKLQIADGEVCETDGTYIAVSGTVVYKCAVSSSASTSAPGTTQASDSSATSAQVTSTSVPSTTSGDQVRDDLDLMRALPRQRAVSGVKAQPFVQSLTVVASASQPLAESQWNSIGRSVQSALEAKKLLFNDEILVRLL